MQVQVIACKDSSLIYNLLCVEWDIKLDSLTDDGSGGSGVPLIVNYRVPFIVCLIFSGNVGCLRSTSDPPDWYDFGFFTCVYFSIISKLFHL